MSETTGPAPEDEPEEPRKGVLGWIERTGNALPDPVFLFLWLIAILVGVSVAAAMLGAGVDHPIQTGPDGEPVRIAAASLLSAENVRRLLVEMPQTFTHFHPLGMVLTVMLGAGVAERAGLFGAAMRAGMRNAPKVLLTPAVAFIAMMASHAADAGYVVLIPLAGALYAAAGRHPVAGIATGFAAVSGGFSANLLPGQLDALLFGITQAGSELLDPAYQVNIAGNWWFIAAMLFLYTPVVWFVTDRIIEPKLGRWRGGAVPGTSDESDDAADAPLTPGQRKGLRNAGLAALFVTVLWTLLAVLPGAPLVDAAAETAGARYAPLFTSLVAGFFVLFLAAGWAYGAAAGSIRNHRDLVDMMTGAMRDMAYYLVLAFAAAHFVAMFGWSNLGLISAVSGASALEASGLPMPVLLTLLVVFTFAINLFVGSASAKWALLAPVLVPMFMLLGVSPEMTTAAYRVGDSASNIITPLMVYFPLTLVFARRWVPGFGLGSLLSAMIPYSFWLLGAGLVLTFFWVLLGIPPGPGADVFYTLPRG